MKRLFKTALVAALLSLPVSAVRAEATASIQGKIIELRGYIMQGLTVTARNNETKREYKTISDEKGFFRFEDLEPGS